MERRQALWTGLMMLSGCDAQRSALVLKSIRSIHLSVAKVQGTPRFLSLHGINLCGTLPQSFPLGSTNRGMFEVDR